MPTITAVNERTGEQLLGRIATWTPLALNDDGSWVEFVQQADRSIQVSGTFGGATVTIQGSNEPSPTSGPTLTDLGGTSLSFTSAGLRSIAEGARQVRPVVTGGDGTTAITVRMVARP